MEVRRKTGFRAVTTASSSLLAVLLLACSPNELVIPRDGPPPAPLPIKGRMFFVSSLDSPDGSAQVFSVKPDGSDTMRVTHPDTNSLGGIISYTSVSISPNLDRLAFTWELSNWFDDPYQLTITDTNLTNLDQRVDWCLSSAVWSPEGEMVAYSLPLAAGFGGPDEMYVISAEGGSSTKITHFIHNAVLDTGVVPLQWIADSTILVEVTVDTPGIGWSNHICELHPDGRITRWILSDSVNDYMAAKISPDGDMLAYIYRPKGTSTRGIGIASPDGADQRAILPELNFQQDGNAYERLSWSPDGSRLGVSSREWILTVNADGSEIDTVLVVSDSEWCSLCDWR